MIENIVKDKEGIIIVRNCHVLNLGCYILIVYIILGVTHSSCILGALPYPPNKGFFFYLLQDRIKD